MSAGVPPVPPPAAGAPPPAEGARADRPEAPRATSTPQTPPASQDSVAAGARVEPAAAPAPLPDALAALAPGTRVTGTIAADADGAAVVFRTADAAAAVLATTPVAPVPEAVLEVIGAEQRLIAVAAAPAPASAVVLAPEPGAAAADATAAAALPPALAALPPGAVVAGTVVPLPDAGAGLLVTDQGVVRIETVAAQAGIAPAPPGGAVPAPPRLPHAGARLALEVVDNARHLIVRQVSPVLAAPPRLALAPAAAVALARTRAQAIAAGGGAVLAPGRTVTGTVVEIAAPRRRAAAAQAGITPPAPLGQPKGAPVVLRLLGYGPPRPPSDGAAPAAVPAAGQTGITATVVGHGRDGRLLVDMADRTVALASDTPLPPGTPLLFEVLPAAAMTPGAVSTADRLAPSPAVAAVAQMAADPAAGAAVAARVPGASASAAAGLIAYLLGLRAGDARPWLGEAAARALDRAGRTGLIERLGEEFRRTWRGGEAGGAELRQLPLPWHDDGRVHQLSLWYGRDQGEGGADDRGDSGTRLVLNLALSRLGQLQIDGLYRKGRFDVVLRSLEPLHEAARRNLRTVFDDALAVSGLAGAIEFQTSVLRTVTGRDG